MTDKRGEGATAGGYEGIQRYLGDGILESHVRIPRRLSWVKPTLFGEKEPHRINCGKGLNSFLNCGVQIIEHQYERGAPCKDNDGGKRNQPCSSNSGLYQTKTLLKD